MFLLLQFQKVSQRLFLITLLLVSLTFFQPLRRLHADPRVWQAATTPVECKPMENRVDAPLIGLCKTVEDGEYLKVEISGITVEVLIYGVATPTENQSYHATATKFTTKLVKGKFVFVYPKKMSDGVIAGWVHIHENAVGPNGDVDVSTELIKNGLAWWDRQTAPEQKKLGDIERDSKAAKRGLWGNKGAIPPWKIRRDALDREVMTLEKREHFKAAVMPDEVTGRPRVFYPSLPPAKGVSITNITKTKVAFTLDGTLESQRATGAVKKSLSPQESELYFQPGEISGLLRIISPQNEKPVYRLNAPSRRYVIADVAGHFELRSLPEDR